MWEVSKPSFFPAKNITLWFTLCSKCSSRYFFPAKKKRRFTLFRESIFFPAKKTADFRHFNRFYVTPRHSTSRVAPTSAVFKLERGSKTRKTKSAGNWMTYFRARFQLINLSVGPLRVPLVLHPIMKMKKLKNICPCHWKSWFFNIFFIPAKKKKKKRSFYSFSN